MASTNQEGRDVAIGHAIVIPPEQTRVLVDGRKVEGWKVRRLKVGRLKVGKVVVSDGRTSCHFARMFRGEEGVRQHGKNDTRCLCFLPILHSLPDSLIP